MNRSNRDWSFAVLPALYALLSLLGIWWLAQRDWTEALITLALALAFDPFDPQRPWPQRPAWQRAWLVAHLAGVLVLAGWLVLR